MTQAVEFTPTLAAEYRKRWNEMKFDPGEREKVAATAKRIHSNKAKYLAIQTFTGVPWWWVGITHNMESGGNFSRHLHNGDPLTGRTVQVPAGRPKTGNPPFSWEESAVDALMMKGLDKVRDWTLERAAYEWERYNGFGYRKYHPDDPSPYLWAKTNQNDGKGKYVADGKWDANAPSERQCGTMPTLQILAELDPSLVIGKRPAGGAVAGGVGGTAGMVVGVASQQQGMTPEGALVLGGMVAIVVGAGLYVATRRGRK